MKMKTGPQYKLKPERWERSSGYREFDQVQEDRLKTSLSVVD